MKRPTHGADGGMFRGHRSLWGCRAAVPPAPFSTRRPRKAAARLSGSRGALFGPMAAQELPWRILMMHVHARPAVRQEKLFDRFRDPGRVVATGRSGLFPQPYFVESQYIEIY